MSSQAIVKGSCLEVSGGAEERQFFLCVIMSLLLSVKSGMRTLRPPSGLLRFASLAAYEIPDCFSFIVF